MSLVEFRQAGVGGGFEAEEDVELTRDRPPGFEQIGMSGHEIDPRLHEDPILPDSACEQRFSQRPAARRVMPEEIVGDEDLAARRFEIPADALDRSLAHRCDRRAATPNRKSSGTGSPWRFQSDQAGR